MDIDIQKFKAVAAIAKSKTNDRRWHNAIDKAVAGVESGWWVITELHNSVAVTTETGKTYFANGVCQCRAYELGQACKHRGLYRLLELYHEAEKETAPAAERQSDKPRTTAATRRAPRAPRVTRGVERDYAGNRFAIVRCEGWMI